jgi:hypothetical protein
MVRQKKIIKIKKNKTIANKKKKYKTTTKEKTIKKKKKKQTKIKKKCFFIFLLKSTFSVLHGVINLLGLKINTPFDG